MGAGKQYRAREGSSISDKVAQRIGKEVEALEAKGERVTPEALVQQARRKTSPIHNLFDWDDASAAAKHRRETARMLLRSVVTLNVRDTKPRCEFYSVAVVDPEEGKSRSYVRRETLISDDAAMNQVSREMYQRLVSIVNEAESLGLSETWAQWRRIAATVRQNEPPGAAGAVSA